MCVHVCVHVCIVGDYCVLGVYCREKERLQQEVKVQENEMISAKDDVQVPASQSTYRPVDNLPHVLHTSHPHSPHHTPTPPPHLTPHTSPPHLTPTLHMPHFPPSQALKNTLQESQTKCQELGAEMSEAQAKLDQLNAEKTSMEQQLFEARRSVEETKIAVSLLQSLQLLNAFVCMCQTSHDRAGHTFHEGPCL